MVNWVRYWFFNLGLAGILLPLAFGVANRHAKKVFLAFLGLFIAANLFQFSADMINNHKFINLWLAISNIYLANLLIKFGAFSG